MGSLIKLIPVIGWRLGGLSMSIAGGGATFAIGKIFLQHFDSGGTLLNFDASSNKLEMRKKFKGSKTLVKDTKKSGPTK